MEEACQVCVMWQNSRALQVHFSQTANILFGCISHFLGFVFSFCLLFFWDWITSESLCSFCLCANSTPKNSCFTNQNQCSKTMCSSSLIYGCWVLTALFCFARPITKMSGSKCRPWTQTQLQGTKDCLGEWIAGLQEKSSLLLTKCLSVFLHTFAY